MGCVHVCARNRSAKSNNGVTSDAGPAILFKSRRVEFLETYNAMSWRKFVLLGCVVACVFAASTATAQMRGNGNSMSRMGMRGAFTPRSIARNADAPRSDARFDGTDANTPHSNDEFSLGPPAL